MFQRFIAISNIYASTRTTALTAALILATGLTACSNPFTENIHPSGDSKEIRPLTAAEAQADYDSMVAAVQSMYGPLEYKERRFGYKFETEAASIRSKFSATTTDAEKQGLFLELLRKLQDGHVSLSIPIRDRYEIPIILMPVENKFLVSRLSPSLAPYGIEVGDEISMIDGVQPETALKTILKYTWFANVESDRHLVYYFFFRPSWIPELVPTQEFAQIEFVKPDGTKKLARIAWKKTSPQQRVEFVPKTDEETPQAINVIRKNMLGADALKSQTLAERAEITASIGDMGLEAPWYWNAKLKRKFGITMVTPERERVQQFYNLWTREMDVFNPAPAPASKIPEKLPELWAALYRYNNKTVLMVRQPSYGPADYILNLAMYSALIEQFQPIADTMVVDQTHNPGGYVSYTEGFAQLFAPTGMNGFVQFLNTDRKWFMSLMNFWTTLDPMTASTATGARILAQAKALERDSELGLRLGTVPFSFSLREVLPAAPGGVVWKKPMIVLIDELCGSGGDSFPMMVKANKLGKLFGNRTSGLGGSVEKVIDLPFTRASLNLTRGLFTTFKPAGDYTDADFVENNGVTPDVAYTHTVKDFRQGFEDYFKAFSDEATR